MCTDCKTLLNEHEHVENGLLEKGVEKDVKKPE
jgi:hypothetical protein